jgi:hypothetical protein
MKKIWAKPLKKKEEKKDDYDPEDQDLIHYGLKNLVDMKNQ